MTSWGHLMKNLAGQAEEFTRAFFRSGYMIRPHVAKRNSRNDNNKLLPLQITSQHKRYHSSCLSYFITGLG